MSGFVVALVLAGVGLVLVIVGYAASRLLAPAAPSAAVSQFFSGQEPTEHAFSRFHVRWYPLTLLYLAFEMEMLFMYPWTLVVAEKGASAVIEMFVFLTILLTGVAYACREGALRWT